MKKNLLKISVIICVIMFSIINVSYGTNDIPSDSSLKRQLYGGGAGRSQLTNATSIIAGVIEYTALGFAVGMLIIKGIKFITASPEGKADIKKQLIPWSIGVVLLFSLITFLNQVVIPMARGF